MILQICTACNGLKKFYRRIGPMEYNDRHGVECWACKGEGATPRKCDNCNEPATHAENHGRCAFCDECAKDFPLVLQSEDVDIKEHIEHCDFMLAKHKK